MERTLPSLDLRLAVSTLVGIILAVALWTCVYNLYFHPLSHIPGPFFSRASGIPYTLRMRNGSIAVWIQDVHRRYGEVVRVAPGECSFISGETAWQDIYGFRTGKHANGGSYLKDMQWFPPPHNGGSYSLVLAEGETHTRMRRNLSHAFSDKALRAQEPLIQTYVNLLVERLQEVCEEGRGVVDMTRWYNYATFDIITDLTFGEPLFCLRDRGYHAGVTLVYAAAKAVGLMAARRKYPMFDYYDRFYGLFADTSKAIRQRGEFFALAAHKTKERIAQGSYRPDFISYILKNNDIGEKALTMPEIVANSALLMVGGSETTATTLSGATYLMLRNPSVHAKVVEEVRSRFASSAQITIEEVNKLDYMIAVLQEALRYYPPVATGFPRVVPVEGDNISGHWIPGGTSVYVSQHAANHSERNFADPDAFIPERWLPDASDKFANDKKAAMSPFSFGPRACLGKK